MSPDNIFRCDAFRIFGAAPECPPNPNTVPVTQWLREQRNLPLRTDRNDNTFTTKTTESSTVKDKTRDPSIV